MRYMAAGGLIILLSVGMGTAAAEEKAFNEIPKDVVELGTVWTEPIKSVGQEARRYDPVSGLWRGLIKGSVKSVERTVDFFRTSDAEPPRGPGEESTGQPDQPDQPLLRYSF